MKKTLDRKTATLLILVAGLVFTCWTTLNLHRAEDQRQRAFLSQSLESQALRLRQSTQRYEDLIRSLHFYFSDPSKVTRAQFAQAATNLTSRYAGVQALEWLPEVPGVERAAWEQRGRNEIGPGFEFRDQIAPQRFARAQDRVRHWPILYAEPLEGNESVIGYDLAGGPTTHQLLHARATGALTVTAPFVLAQSRNKELGIVMILPVGKTTTSPTADPDFKGFLEVVFRLEDMLDATWPKQSNTELQHLGIAIRDITDPQKPLFAYSRGIDSVVMETETGHSSPAGLVRFGGRDWQVTVYPTPAWLDAYASSRPTLVVVAGTLISFLLAGYVSALFGRTELVEQLVRQRTAALEESQQRLRTSEESYRALFDLAHDAIVIVRDGVAIRANRRAEELFGCTAEDFALAPPYRMSPETQPNGMASEELADRYVAKALAGEPQRFEWQHRRKDNTLFDAEVSIYRVEQPGQHPVIQVIVRDITEHKRAEESEARLEARLRQAQKLEAIGTLAGGIAHDFNNILGAIMGYADLALEHAKAIPDLQNSLNQIQVASERAKNLVKQILAFSRQNPQQRRPIGLEPVVLEALSLLRSTLPATIEIVDRIDTNLPQVLGDPTQMHQVVVNLCTNAAHAMRSRAGKLTVLLHRFRPDSAFIASHPDLRERDYVRLTVQDTGHGMDAETLKHIFEPFFTTKAPSEGTGLGLAVVHGIVQDHEGTIYVNSQLGAGSEFELFLPALEAPRIAGATHASSIPRGQGERILFVDDEKALGIVGGRILKHLNYQACVFNSPQEALESFRATPADFDLVITDLSMPGMTGIDLADALRRIRPDIPIILCTGFSGTWDREAIRRRGIQDLVLKPLNLIDLAESIQGVLRQG